MSTLYNSIRNKTASKLDENEININILLFGNDQLHLETNKILWVFVCLFLAIVHDLFIFIDFFFFFLLSLVKPTACKSVKVW